MYKVYTHEAHMQLIGGYPSLYIEDDGLIYTQEQYSRLLGRSACGKVDFANKRVYGSDYNSYFCSPVAEFTRSGDEIRIYKGTRGFGDEPILYVKDDKIYTSEQYYRIMGRQPCGHIQTVADLGGVLKDDGGSGDGGSGGGAGCSLPFWGLVVAALVIWFVLRIAKFLVVDMTGMGGSMIACILFSILTFKIGPVAHLEKDPNAMAQCKAKATNSASIVAMICGALWALTIYNWFTASGNRTDLLLLLLAEAVVFTAASFFTAKRYFYRRYLVQTGGNPSVMETVRKKPGFKARVKVQKPRTVKQKSAIRTDQSSDTFFNDVFSTKITVRCPRCGEKHKVRNFGADSGAINCHKCHNFFIVKGRL